MRTVSLKMALEVETEAPLSVAGRLNRAVSFYSAAVPIFASYKLLDRQFKFQREVLGQTISDQKVEEEFRKLHEWGSDILKVKIEDLKGKNWSQHVKKTCATEVIVVSLTLCELTRHTCELPTFSIITSYTFRT